jgi:hypothetical protein
MKKSNYIYYALGAYALFFLYKKYYKAAPVSIDIIKNQSTLLSPAEQVAAPVTPVSEQASFNVKYSLSGTKYKLPQTL